MFIPEELELYIQNHSDKEDEVLSQLSRETHIKMMHPRMLSGNIQGQILENFSRMLSPKRILELGTYTGYSAICLAKGLAEDGLLTSIEVDDEVVSLAQKYIDKSGLSERIEIRVGDADVLLDEISEMFDLVFMDADKSQYVSNYEKVLPKVKSGGYIIADNVLWSGKVLEKHLKNNDYFTKGILAFNSHVQNDERVSNYILPIRDGMMIIRKK